MPGRGDAGAAVVVVAPDEDAGVVVAEVEPNDLLASAQAIELKEGGAGIVIAGRLVAPPGASAKAKDVDLYRVVVPAPSVVIGDSGVVRRRLAVKLMPEAGLAAGVEALDEQGKVLVAAAAATPGEVEGIPNLAVLPGTYFLRVKAGGASASAAQAVAGASAPAPGVAYRMALRLLPLEPGDEVEPNGKGALASEVAMNGEVAGYLGWRRDEDWFRLPLAGLPEGSALSVDLDPVDGVAASVAIYDSVEHKMTEQHARKGERVALRNVRLPSSDPHMFLVVRADSGRNLDARYIVHLHTEEPKPDAELEPNDDPAHAVPLSDGQFVGYLGPGDVDVYRYTAASPVEIDVEVTPPERVDLKIEIIREDGTVLSKIDTGKRHEAERIANLYVPAGSVLLRLAGAKGDGNLDEPYRIAVTSKPADPAAEREPNGTAALATQLADGATGSGLVFPRGDVDYWLAKVAPEAVGAAGLAAAVRPIPGLTLDVRVQSLGGRELVRWRVGGDASAPAHVTPGADGCCLIQIREATGRAANARDRYTLSVAPAS